MAIIKLDPTLFVFLGTSPAEVGWRIKKHIDNAYGDIPIFKYFWVDTDSRIGQNEMEWVKTGAVARSQIGNFDSSVVLSNIDRFPQIKSWWPPETKMKPGHLGKGAKQIRLIGRLSLFRMFDDASIDPEGSLATKLEESFKEILSVENRQAIRSKKFDNITFEVSEKSVRVFIISSSCGGTGSGMTFDIAYLCRQHLQREGIISTITGVTILPSVMTKVVGSADAQQKDKIMANSYAWFKENDYLVEKQEWNVSYPGLNVDIKNSPFDVNFVVEMSNQAGQFLNSAQDIYKMIAQSLFVISSTSIAGNYDSIKDNMGITNTMYDQRLRSYSSFATASLVFPKERIRKCAGSRLGEEILRNATVIPRSLNEHQLNSTSFISQMGINYQALIERLLGNHRVRNDNFEFIQAASLPGEALAKITEETTNDEIEVSTIKEFIKKDGEILKVEKKALLRNNLLTLLAQEGPGYLSHLLDKLIEEGSAKSPSSFGGQRKAIDLHGIGIDAIAAARNELEDNRKDLADMSASFTSTVFRWTLKKEWKEKFKKTKNNCLASMENLNNFALRNAAEESAKAIYDDLIKETRELRTIINGLIEVFNQAADELKNDAEHFMTVSFESQNLFELNREVVDRAYIEKYYTEHTSKIDKAAIYNQFIRQQVQLDFDHLAAWSKSQVTSAIRNTTEEIFAPDLEKVNILDAIQESYGDKSQEFLVKELDSLINYCHPFWRFSSDTGLSPLPQGPGFIGIMDEASPLLPKEYRDHNKFQVVSTGLKDTIHFVKILHGVPSSLFSNVPQWKLAYENALKDGIDPLHIFPGAKDADEVIPDTDNRPRAVFAFAMAYGFITKRGSYYYYDPEHRYGDLKVRPEQEHKIATGRTNAEDIFIQHPDWIDKVEDNVDRENQRIGNDAAVKFLESKITELDDEKFKLKSDNQLRAQYDKEIKALKGLMEELSAI